MPAGIPELDDELRERLGRRYGSGIGGWFAELPDVLEELAERWGVEWGTPIQRGSMAVVIRCQTTDGRAAVLTVSPDRERLAQEAAALARCPERYERSRNLALRLAAEGSPTVLLHGDLTPVNVLDGGVERGLVATGALRG